MVDMQRMTKVLNGAEIVIETLKNLEVDTIFGYPGGIILQLYDQLYHEPAIKHYLNRHEQASIHAAEGYARAHCGKKPGVVLVTSGPGATNVVTGLANAYLDGYPLVVLTGQVSKDLIGKDAFQEVNIVDITKSCTKKTYQVTDACDLEKTLVEAFETALTGKKGPVLVDLAKNIFNETADFEGLTLNIDNEVNWGLDKVPRILSLLNEAKRPVIIAGAGVIHANATKELATLVCGSSIPVVSTMMGLGAFPQDNLFYFGMIGLFGSYSANEILRRSDLIISLGTRFNDRIRVCFQKGELSRNLIQVDINDCEIFRVLNARLGIRADIKALLNRIIPNFTKDYSEWLEEAQVLKAQNRKPAKRSDKLHSFEVIDILNSFTRKVSLTIATEVGQHQLWCAKGYKFKRPGQFISSGGLGTMGFGLPAAIGACIAQKKMPVICIAGDGSLQMNLQELATCVEYGLPVKIMVLNNGYLGMVRQLQEKMCDKRYSQTQIQNPDFVKLAQAYGIEAVRVEKAEDVLPALSKSFSSNKPFLIDFIVEPMEVV